MKRFFFIVLGVLLFLIVGLIVYGTYLNQSSEAQISERMSNQSIPLRAAVVKERMIKPQLSIDTVNLYSDKMADAVTLIDGRITAINVQKHEHVVAGQTLYTVTNETYPIRIRQADIDISKAENDILQAENEVMKSETALAKAKNDFGRYSRLRARDAVTAEKYEEVEATYREAQVNVENRQVQKERLEAQKEYYVAQKEQLLLEQSYAKVTAPLDGEVLILYRPQGSYVNAGTAMALVGDFQKLNFSMAIDDRLAQRLSPGQKATVVFSRSDFAKIYDTGYESGNAGKAQEFTAILRDISPGLEEAAAMRKVIWEIDNSAGLLEPQTYNNVSIKSFLAHLCLTVPLSAMANPARTVVFVVAEDGRLYRREITAGADDGEYIEIISGLEAGDVVVTSGTDGLEDGMNADITYESGED